jgi:hypothetical protein
MDRDRICYLLWVLRAAWLKHGANGFLPKIGLQRNLMAEIRRLFPDRTA